MSLHKLDSCINVVHSVRDRPAWFAALLSGKFNTLTEPNHGAGCFCFDFYRAKGYFMELPSILQGESLKRLLQGTALGAVAAIAIGFNLGGWMLGSTAELQAANGAKSAVVAVLAPICAEKFQSTVDASTNLEKLKKESTYKQASFVEKGGWAILPGNDKAGDGVAKACAVILNDLK
jgi:hypothetical protein